MSSTAKKKVPLLGALCLLLTAVIVIAGLWPFNFNPLNRVELLQDGKGLRFYGRGSVQSREPLVMQGAGSTIELVVRPERESSNGVRSLITLFDGNRPDGFMMGQWKKELIIRVPAGKEGSPKHYREVSVGDALIKDTTAFLAVTSSKEQTVVFVNGRVAGRFPRYALIPGDKGLSGYLLLGNSPDGNNSWRGSVSGLAIYDRVLDEKDIQGHYAAWNRSGRLLFSGDSRPVVSYLFDDHRDRQIADLSGSRNDLLVPESFHPLQRRVLDMPDEDLWFRRANLIDVAVNITGFVPFGLFLAAWLMAGKDLAAVHACAVTALLGFCLSLAIELTQAYIPGRDSSLLDVVSNTVGTAIGVFLLNYAPLVLPSTGSASGQQERGKTYRSS